MAKILVVDDERDVIEMLQFVLGKQGHTILEATDGIEGLEKARTERPELIVLDVMMPEMDGFTMNGHLLKDASTRDIPIVILTAKGHMRDAFAMSANVKAYVEKPFEPKELIKRIEETLDGKEQTPP